MSQNSKPDEFEQYLHGKSELTQRYAGLPEPDFPGHLDAAILAEAHRAVGARPGGKSSRRWTIPLGMVATLFVVVMVGLQLPYLLKDAASPEQYREEKIAGMMDQSTAERSAAVPVERRKLQDFASAKSNFTPKERSAPAAEADVYAKPDAAMRAAPQELNVAGEEQFGTTTVQMPPPVMAPSPAPAKAAKRLESRESMNFDQGISQSQAKKRAVNTEGGGVEAREQDAPAAASVAPHPAQLERVPMQLMKDEASDAIPTPEDWLLRINKLKQQGKLEEAKKELAAFKKRYPDYPVTELLESR